MKKTVRFLLIAAAGLLAFVAGLATTSANAAADNPVVGWAGTIAYMLGGLVLLVSLVAATVIGFRRAWKWSRS